MNLRINQIINCPVSAVYNAFTDSVILSKWFTSNAKVDLKVGGKYNNDDGDEGEFLEIKENEKLKFTWENKQYCPGTIVDFYFKPISENETEVELIHSELLTEAHISSMKTGWTWAMHNVKMFLEEGKTIKYNDWLEQVNNKKNY